MDQLSWPRVRGAASHMFQVWYGQPELEWARTSWQILHEEGLTGYESDSDRASVQLRLIALSVLYRSFCVVAWAERVEDTPGSLFAEAGWSVSGVLKLYGDDDTSTSAPGDHGDQDHHEEHDDDEEDDPSEDYQYIESVVSGLVSERYSGVLQSLEAGYGGMENLFTSLLLSQDTEWAGLRRFSPEGREVALEWGRSRGTAARDWLEGGAHPLV